MYEETITITPVDFSVGHEILMKFCREDDADDQTGEFHLQRLLLRYSDT